MSSWILESSSIPPSSHSGPRNTYLPHKISNTIDSRYSAVQYNKMLHTAQQPQF